MNSIFSRLYNLVKEFHFINEDIENFRKAKTTLSMEKKLRVSMVKDMFKSKSELMSKINVIRNEQINTLLYTDYIEYLQKKKDKVIGYDVKPEINVVYLTGHPEFIEDIKEFCSKIYNPFGSDVIGLDSGLAQDFLFSLYDFAKIVGDVDLLLYCCRWLGKIFHEFKDFDKAASIYREGSSYIRVLHEINSLDSKKNVIRVSVNIIAVLHDKGDYEEAIEIGKIFEREVLPIYYRQNTIPDDGFWQIIFRVLYTNIGSCFMLLSAGLKKKSLPIVATISESIKSFKEALDWEKKILGVDTVSVNSVNLLQALFLSGYGSYDGFHKDLDLLLDRLALISDDDLLESRSEIRYTILSAHYWEFASNDKILNEDKIFYMQTMLDFINDGVIAVSDEMEVRSYLRPYIEILFLERGKDPVSIGESVIRKILAQKQKDTAVHVITVARINKLFLGALYDKHPECLKSLLDFSKERYGIEFTRESLLDFFYLGGLLHDLGKVGETAFVSQSSRPLTEYEFSRLKYHTKNGADVISGINDYLDILKSFLLNHHIFQKNVDMSDPMSITYRVTSCSDVSSAGTDPFRPYKGVKAVKDMAKELSSLAGNQFDPIVVSLLDDPDVYEQYRYYLEEGLDDVIDEIFFSPIV